MTELIAMCLISVMLTSVVCHLLNVNKFIFHFSYCIFHLNFSESLISPHHDDVFFCILEQKKCIGLLEMPYQNTPDLVT